VLSLSLPPSSSPTLTVVRSERDNLLPTCISQEPLLLLPFKKCYHISGPFIWERRRPKFSIYKTTAAYLLLLCTLSSREPLAYIIYAALLGERQKNMKPSLSKLDLPVIRSKIHQSVITCHLIAFSLVLSEDWRQKIIITMAFSSMLEFVAYALLLAVFASQSGLVGKYEHFESPLSETSS